jgi:hypothetical protein
MRRLKTSEGNKKDLLT